MTTAPYGSWPSPISVEDLTGATVGLAAPTVDGSDLYWLEAHADQGGRVSLWRVPLDGGDPVEVSPPGVNVRTPGQRIRRRRVRRRPRRGRLFRSGRRPAVRGGRNRCEPPPHAGRARLVRRRAGRRRTRAGAGRARGPPPRGGGRARRGGHQHRRGAPRRFRGVVVGRGGDPHRRGRLLRHPPVVGRRPAGLGGVGPSRHAVGRHGPHRRAARGIVRGPDQSLAGCGRASGRRRTRRIGRSAPLVC